VVICLGQGIDLHMAQLKPLSLAVSCFSIIQIGFIFLFPAHLDVLDKGLFSGCCCSKELFFCHSLLVNMQFFSPKYVYILHYNLIAYIGKYVYISS